MPAVYLPIKIKDTFNPIFDMRFGCSEGHPFLIVLGARNTPFTLCPQIDLGAGDPHPVYPFVVFSFLSPGAISVSGRFSLSVCLLCKPALDFESVYSRRKNLRGCNGYPSVASVDAENNCL